MFFISTSIVMFVMFVCRTAIMFGNRNPFENIRSKSRLIR